MGKSTLLSPKLKISDLRMKIYPRTEQSERKKRLSGLPLLEIIQRYLAIILAFASTYLFFVKLVFL